jgi:hypothetical protein
MVSIELGISVALLELGLGVIGGNLFNLDPNADWLVFIASFASIVLTFLDAVLPAFVLGLVMARHYEDHQKEQERLRVVAFAFLTPFFFLRGGMNVSLGAVFANLGVLGVLVALWAERAHHRPHTVLATRDGGRPVSDRPDCDRAAPVLAGSRQGAPTPCGARFVRGLHGAAGGGGLGWRSTMTAARPADA